MTQVQQPSNPNFTVSEQPLEHPAGGWKLQTVTQSNTYGGTRIEVHVFDGKTFWTKAGKQTEDEKSVITVEIYLNETAERYGNPVAPEISWPSTSDRRPELAYALSLALQTAYAITAPQRAIYEKGKEDSDG